MHRDLKPENVFLAAPGERVVVLDFGLTRWLGTDRAGSVVTEQGVRLGTVPYMAPEQLTDATTVDEAADVWAIGVLLYECLTGYRPFEGRSEPELVRRILTDAVTPLSVAAPHLPVAMAELASQLLVQDREERRRMLPDAIRILGALVREPTRG
jgi:serine/threonine-protein kinase